MKRLSIISCLALVCAVVIFSGCEKKDGVLYYDSSRKGTAEAPVKDVPKDILRP